MKLKKNWVKIVLFVLGVVILAVAAYICLPKILQLLGFLVKLFLPFLLGYLFSMAVNPLADTLQKRLKIPRGLSAVLVIVLIVGIFGGVLTFAIWKMLMKDECYIRVSDYLRKHSKQYKGTGRKMVCCVYEFAEQHSTGDYFGR